MYFFQPTIQETALLSSIDLTRNSNCHVHVILFALGTFSTLVHPAGQQLGFRCWGKRCGASGVIVFECTSSVFTPYTCRLQTSG